MNARLDAFFNERDSSLTDLLMEDDGRETSADQDRETSGLEFMFSESDERASVSEIFNQEEANGDRET